MIRCEAVIDNPKLRDNLVQCIEILGGDPCVEKSLVIVTTEKNEDEMIKLFEQFTRHCICTNILPERR